MNAPPTLVTTPTGAPGLATLTINGTRLSLPLVLSLPVVVDLSPRGVLDASHRAIARVSTGSAYPGHDGAPVLPRCEVVAVHAHPHGDRLVRVASPRPTLILTPAVPVAGAGRWVASTRLPVALLEDQ